MDHLFTVAGRSATPVSPTGLAAEGLFERQHLQEWVIDNPQILGESVLVITAEFDRWTDMDGVPARGRLDILGLDVTGHLVVVELKRGTADRDVHLQAIAYAALVSRFDLDTLAQAHRDFLASRKQALDLEAVGSASWTMSTGSGARSCSSGPGRWSPPPTSQTGHPHRGVAVGAAADASARRDGIHPRSHRRVGGRGRQPRDSHLEQQHRQTPGPGSRQQGLYTDRTGQPHLPQRDRAESRRHPGTTWWVVDTSHVPDDVGPDEWVALAGADLASLAKRLNGTGKDWTGLHNLPGAIPPGRWTTYGDVATVIGSHAVPVGTHLATCDQYPNPWRVLNAAGRVSTGFRWADPTRTDTPADILTAEGIRFDGDTAAREARLPLDELQRLPGS
ncbi:hypothetical protein ACLIYP_03385 [Streptomyces nanhaiensis]|uniref:hypothetical protein n=1 Tax=Streptomyces nanhaiensis TaxID=679319 RepID=UPI00399CF450